MGDVHIPEDPQEPGIGSKVADLIASGHEFYALTVTGDRQGRIRRPTLFAIAALGVIVTLVIDGTVGLVSGTIALIAILLLAMSDNTFDLPGGDQ